MYLRNITSNRYRELLKKYSIISHERFLIDSYTYIPLVDFCGNIQPNEIEIVHSIEDKNIMRFLDIAGMALGIKENTDLKEMIAMPTDSYERDYTNIKIQGRMPSKLFSFRQRTANKWFRNFVNVKLDALETIYIKMGIKHAREHLLANTAYFLYKSQPNRYDIIDCQGEKDALQKILEQFLIDRNENPTAYFDGSGEINCTFTPSKIINQLS